MHRRDSKKAQKKTPKIVNWAHLVKNISAVSSQTVRLLPTQVEECNQEYDSYYTEMCPVKGR